MKRITSTAIAAAAIIIVANLFFLPGNAFATFSIVAVDTLTGEIASAGISCSQGVSIIEDIVEGVGAINTQSWYLAANQDNAHDRMVEGMTPSEIIAWLVAHDAGLDPDIRQYGIVTLIGPGASAAYSGALNPTWNGHSSGPGYSVQGNRLLGPEIVDLVEAAFLATEGALEDRIFAALEAGNVPGADSECLSCNKPGISAFIKVVRPGDGATPYLFEQITTTICSVNPMDGLRDKFYAWKALQIADPDSSTITVMPQMYFLAGFSDPAMVTVAPRNSENNPPTDGMAVALANSGGGVFSEVTDNGDGTFSANLSIPASAGVDTVTAYVTAGGMVVEVSDTPVLTYLGCGDANADFGTDVGDAVFLINYVFKGGPAPILIDAGDANCDSTVDVGDAVYLINYAFKSGPAPCTNCP